MTLARSALLLFAMLIVSGCRLDNLLTTARDPGPISFAVHVEYDDLDAGVLRVIGSLLLPRGGGHTVTNDTISVAGSPVAPVRIDREGGRFYDAAWLGTSLTGSMPHVMVMGPIVDEAAPLIAWQIPIYRRDGSAVIQLGSGALQLPLSVASTPELPAWSTWELSLSNVDDALTHIAGTGVPPNPIVVSRSLLPPGTGDVKVRLTVLQTADAADHTYWLRTAAISRLYWTVRR